MGHTIGLPNINHIFHLPTLSTIIIALRMHYLANFFGDLYGCRISCSWVQLHYMFHRNALHSLSSELPHSWSKGSLFSDCIMFLALGNSSNSATLLCRWKRAHAFGVFQAHVKYFDIVRMCAVLDSLTLVSGLHQKHTQNKTWKWFWSIWYWGQVRWF